MVSWTEDTKLNTVLKKLIREMAECLLEVLVV